MPVGVISMALKRKSSFRARQLAHGVAALWPVSMPGGANYTHGIRRRQLFPGDGGSSQSRAPNIIDGRKRAHRGRHDAAAAVDDCL